MKQGHGVLWRFRQLTTPRVTFCRDQSLNSASVDVESGNENPKKTILRSQCPRHKRDHGHYRGRYCLSHIVLMHPPRSGRATQLEEDPCIRPFLQPWVTGNQQNDTSQQLPDADDPQEIQGIAKVRHDVSDRGPGHQDFLPCTRSVTPPTSVSRAIRMVTVQ